VERVSAKSVRTSYSTVANKEYYMVSIPRVSESTRIDKILVNLFE
jgi:hypothetical protein